MTIHSSNIRAVLLLAASVFGGALIAAHYSQDAMAEAAVAAPVDASKLATATFASGCFWCSESDFEKVDGVVSVVSGYTGGTTPNPTYEQVGNGGTGHTEAIEVKYDPSKVSYQSLVDHFFRTTDFLDGGGQFCDRGDSYRPAIFTHSPEQKSIAADAGKSVSARFRQPHQVQIAEAVAFTAAEDYHQDYYKKNPIKYRYYRNGCGRDQRLKELWGEAGH